MNACFQFRSIVSSLLFFPLSFIFFPPFFLFRPPFLSLSLPLSLSFSFSLELKQRELVFTVKNEKRRRSVWLVQEKRTVSSRSLTSEVSTTVSFLPKGFRFASPWKVLLFRFPSHPACRSLVVERKKGCSGRNEQVRVL